jgi:hypothetical protein
MCKCDSDFAKLPSSEYKIKTGITIENQKIPPSFFSHLHQLVGLQTFNDFNREKRKMCIIILEYPYSSLKISI